MAEEVAELAKEHTLEAVLESIRTLDFFANDSDECLERACDNPASSGIYCRFHYIKNWKEIKKKQGLLEEGKLQNYVEELVTKFPIKIVETILTDLADDKTFFNTLKEMNIDATDESFDDAEDEGDDQDIAYETKVTNKPGFDE